MRRWIPPATLILLAVAFVAGTASGEATADSATGAPEIRSMSALAFGPDGVLFIGDSKAGAVVAVDLGESAAEPPPRGIAVSDVEGKVASILGTTPDSVMIHDMAVSPVSHQVYLAVSRGRSKWDSAWLLPNDVADATLLLRVDAAGEMNAVPLDDVRFSRAALPNPVSPEKTHRWKEGIGLRGDTITDLSFAADTLYVAGLSNEEFASTLWRIPYPFRGESSATTLEIFHGAHGEYETHAPIRTFVPYELGGEDHLLAAYLCTPLVTFPLSELQDGAHVKGRTVAEFGSGNYPLDMIVYRKGGEKKLLIANSNLPYMIVDPKDIERYEGSIDEKVEGYVDGVAYEPRSGSGVQQLDNLGDEIVVALRRLPGGLLNLESISVRRF